METLGKLILDFAHRHPAITGWIVVVVALALLVTNGLRLAWPEYAETPRLVRFILGFFDPIAGNIWNLARKVDPGVVGQAKQKGNPNEPG